jgi:hypothetical protein
MIFVVIVECIWISVYAELDNFLPVHDTWHAAVLRLSVRDQLERVIAVKHQAAHRSKRADKPLPVSKSKVLDACKLCHLFGHLPAHHIAHCKGAELLDCQRNTVAL